MNRFFSVLIAACLFSAPAYAQAVKAKPPEGAKQPAAHFDHKLHGIDSKGDKKQASCAKCHDAVAKVTAGDSKPTNPAHALCLECHKKEENKAKAPSACNKCHVK